MSRLSLHCVYLLLLLCLLFGVIHSAQGNVRWTLLDLGTLGGNYSAATSINDTGQIVGLSTTLSNEQSHAFLYRKGQMLMLEPIEVRASSAIDINDLGEIVGLYIAPDRVGFHPFIYSEDSFFNLDYPGAKLTGINNASAVVGYGSMGPKQEVRGFIFHQSTLQVLGTLGGGVSVATAINNNGQVVGFSQLNKTNYTQAFMYEDGKLRSLGTLGGLRSLAHHINDGGLIVGASETVDGQTHGFLYFANQMHDLGTLGGKSSDARGINNLGHVVGMSETINGVSHAFLYTQGKMVDLNAVAGVRDLGWILVCASAINNHDQIVGYGTIGGQTHAFLLSPDRSEPGQRP